MDVLDLIERHEGFRAHPYLCTANKLTIGIGRNLDDKGITREEARWLLKNDVDEAIAHLRNEPYWLDLSEVRQAVLIDMCVNLGWSGFSKFRNLRAALLAAAYKQAADAMVASAWYKQVGNRSKRLVGMMQHDVWPTKF